ncbi:MAG: hypothetical protein DDT20_00946 [Firmicutes bacterium]|nr:hypothetical protein [Bacillota bacterium]
MTFAHWLALLFGISTVLYVAAAVAYWYGLRPGMTVTFVGYTLANLGLIWVAFHSVPK